MKCEICGSDSVLHVTDGSTVTHHYCELHAGEAMRLVPSSEKVAASVVPRLRSLASFIRSENRMPKQDEMQVFGAAGDLIGSLPQNGDLRIHSDYLERLANFIEDQGRYPSEEELPDPF